MRKPKRPRSMPSAPAADAGAREEPRHGWGLLTRRRQERWLRGLAYRWRSGAADRLAAIARHERESAELEQRHALLHQQTSAECRGERRSVLDGWDSSDERVIAEYEAQTLQARKERHHALALLRKQRKQAVSDEEQQYDEARNRIRAQYAQEKPKPTLLEQQEIAALGKRVARIRVTVNAARELAMQRLGGPSAIAEFLQRESDADAGGTPVETHPESLKESLARLDMLAEESEAASAELRAGWPAKFAESYYLVLPVLGVALLWCGGVYLLGVEHMLLWMVAGIPVAVVAGVATHTAMMVPLRRQTREHHPAIEQIRAQAAVVASGARRASAGRAAARVAELRRERDAALESLRVSHERVMLEIREKFAADEKRLIASCDARMQEIEQSFHAAYGELSREMVAAAEATAARLSERMANCEADAKRDRDALQAAHWSELEHLRLRVEQGVQRGLRRAEQNAQAIGQEFPPWEHVLADPVSDATLLRWLPLGWLGVESALRESVGQAVEQIPSALPLVLPRREQAAVIVDCPPDQLPAAARWMRAVLWRSLTGGRPGRVRLTLLDPVGRGQNFASLVALGDHDPQLINHRAWSAPSQIATRLSELTQHVEDLLQAGLRDRYDAIEDFNLEAGALAEPYRVVAAVGLPAGLNRDACEALRALIDGGRRCGVFLILVRDASQPWPAELPALPETNVLRLRFDDRGGLWHAGSETLGALPIEPLEEPPAGAIASLTDRIGTRAVALQRVEIPLDECVPAADYDSADSASGLSIPVGRQGVGRSLAVELGTGMRQHVLVAGKTGSGKSTLLHSLITAAALLYPPDQLHLYLLDFKKGVEFKIYADCGLPHARVIGIESEREFGRSVLERLDAELQRRGEQFRAQGVQELSEFRRRTGHSLPRILFIVDEFQELFIRDDRLAQECTMLLDRLVRQGRSFGMHVVLSSQSLSGAYTLPRATLGQMAIRIALQCSESDAALILADENAAARLLSRPGEAIFNDAGGQVEGNQPFQVAWIGPDQHRQRLLALAARHGGAEAEYGATVVFEGNRPTRWTPALASSALAPASLNSTSLDYSSLNPSARNYSAAAPLVMDRDSEGGNAQSWRGLIGESVRIGPAATLTLCPEHGRNVVCVTDAEAIAGVLTAWIPTFVADVRRRLGRAPEIILLDGQRRGESDFHLAQWLQGAGIDHRLVQPRDAEAALIELAGRVSQLPEEAPGPTAERPVPTVVVINALERFRELRQDDTYGFSLDAGAAASGATALQTLLRDGPQALHYVILHCSAAETVSRWLPRTSQHDLQLRIVGRLSASDSAQWIDTPEATDLSPASLLLYDDAEGSLEKFRICAVPSAGDVRRWLGTFGRPAPPLVRPDPSST